MSAEEAIQGILDCTGTSVKVDGIDCLQITIPKLWLRELRLSYPIKEDEHWSLDRLLG